MSSWSVLLGLLLVVVPALAVGAPGAVHPAAEELAKERLGAPFDGLKALSTRLPPAAPGDWISSHPEPGQSLAGYRKSDPVRPLPARSTIWIAPLGPFTGGQLRVITLTARYLELHFGLPVHVGAPIPLERIPPEARRINEDTGKEQLLTSFILHELLLPRRPPTSVAYLALTASDLWPAPGWNFVFGQASLGERVGVWSIARLGPAELGDEALRLTLLRTLKIAVHETGHILGLHHCVSWACVENGSNSQDETDRAPLDLCPACLAKLTWNTGQDPVARYEGLAAFAGEHGLDAEERGFRRRLTLLRKAGADR